MRASHVKKSSRQPKKNKDSPTKNPSRTHAQSFLHSLLQAQKKPPSRRTSTTYSHARRFTPSALLPLFLHAEPPPPPHRSPVHAIPLFPLFLHAEPPPLPHSSPEQNDFKEEEFAGAWKQTGAAVSYERASRLWRFGVKEVFSELEGGCEGSSVSAERS